MQCPIARVKLGRRRNHDISVNIIVRLKQIIRHHSREVSETNVLTHTCDVSEGPAETVNKFTSMVKRNSII